MQNLFKILKDYKYFILFSALLFSITISIINLFKPLEYQANVGLLITPKSTIGVDTYSSIKSAERIANNLKFLIYTSNFINKVLKDPQIDKEYFKKDKFKLKKQWGKIIETNVIYNTGYLYINVYHESPTQAQIIANKIADILLNDSNDYLNQDIFVKIEKIDDTVVSPYIVRPHFIRDAILAFIIGFLFALSYLIIKEDLIKL